MTMYDYAPRLGALDPDQVGCLIGVLMRIGDLEPCVGRAFVLALEHAEKFHLPATIPPGLQARIDQLKAATDDELRSRGDHRG